MSIITLARVKTELGITNGTYDAQITALIPTAEAKYRQIANYNFSSQFVLSYKNGDSFFTPGSIDYSFRWGDAYLSVGPNPNSIIYDLFYGDLIEGTGVDPETYITSVDKINNKVYVNNAFTADGDNLIFAQNISYWSTISAMIWFLIGKQSITNQDTFIVSSRSVGPLSVSFDAASLKSASVSRYGLPESIINAIPVYASMS